MKGKTLLILAAAAAVLAGLATLTSRRSHTPAPPEIGRPLLPGLSSNLNDVVALAVLAPDGTSRVERADTQWTVPQRHGYPADFAKIKALLLKLSELKIGQVVRADDKQRARLRMTPPGGAAAAQETGTSIRLEDARGAALATLLVGTPHTRAASAPGGYAYPDGTYVSPDAGRSVYLVGTLLEDLPGDPKAWMDTELFNVPAQDASTITITGAGRAEVRLTRNAESGQFEVAGVATNEQTDSSKLYSVQSALGYMRLDDVADPALTDGEMGFDAPVVYTLTTTTDTVYTVRVGGPEAGAPDSGRRYARFAVAPAEPDPENEAPAEEATDDAEAKRKERIARAAAVAEFNKRLSGWTYLLPAHKIEGLTATRETLVKPRAETETAQPETSGAEPADNGAGMPADEGGDDEDAQPPE